MQWGTNPQLPVGARAAYATSAMHACSSDCPMATGIDKPGSRAYHSAVVSGVLDHMQSRFR